MDKMVSVNNKRLIFAREYYGLSIPEVANKAKIDSDDIVAFEDGSAFPSFSQLNRLAEYYGQSLLFFFFPSQPKEDKLTIKFRNLEKSSNTEISKKVKEMMVKANIYRLNLIELNENDNPVSFKEEWQKDTITKETLTTWLRKKLCLSLEEQQNFKGSEGLLAYIREEFYKIGIYIFKDSFHDNSVSGLCLYDDKFPIILLNNKTTFSRQLFTVFHELYHIFLQETDVDFTGTNIVEERKCNVFASEFLIPQSDFNKELSGVANYENETAIGSLAKTYCVSRDAIRYRLLKEGKISQDFYAEQRADDIRSMNPQKAGGNFYHTKMSYLGKTYLTQVFSKYYSGKISISKVGMYTQLKVAHVSTLATKMFGGAF